MENFIKQHLKDDNNDFKLNFIKKFVPDYKFVATDIEFYLEFWDSVVVYKMFTLEELNYILEKIDFYNFIDIYDFEIKKYIILTSQENDNIDVYVSDKTYGKIFSDAITNLLLSRLKKTILNKIFGVIPECFNEDIIPTDNIVKPVSVRPLISETPSCESGLSPSTKPIDDTSSEINTSEIDRVVKQIDELVKSEGNQTNSDSDENVMLNNKSIIKSSWSV